MRRQGAVFTGTGAAERLARLGLTPGILESAVREADRAAGDYTVLDPPNMAGMARYSRTVRALRERLLPRGWSYDNPRNLARTVSPDRRVAVIAAAGDAATGHPEVAPSTRYEKGLATLTAVNRNFLQQPLPLDFGDGLDLTRDEVETATWVLLYHVTVGEIRAELSLPDSMVDGFIDTWAERVVLTAVPVSGPASWDAAREVTRDVPSPDLPSATPRSVGPPTPVAGLPRQAVVVPGST